MNFRPSSLFTAAYRMEAGDRIALGAALDRTYALRVFAGFTGWFGLVTLAYWFSGKNEYDVFFTIDSLLRGRSPLWLYALLLLPPALAALQPLLGRLFIALLQRGKSADRDVHLDFTADGIEGNARGLFSRIAWTRVTRLVETPEHLFILVAGHDPVVLPRRALPDAANYHNLLGFIRARTGLRTAALT